MFDRSYIQWNHARIKKIIDHFGHDAFFEKTVLDLGCGLSDLGGALARLGARVIAVDARQHHLDIAKKKYPHINTICVDLDQKWPFVNQRFDYVLCLGIICHLTNYKQVLQRACALTSNLILESEVCDSEDPDRVIRVDEHRSIYDWAFNGIGTKPSAPNLESIMRESGMSFKRYDTPDLNTGPYKYDWQVSKTDSRKIGYRRFWIATREQPGTPILPPMPVLTKESRTRPNPVPLTIRPEIVISAQTREPKKDGFRTAICISGYMRSFEQTFERMFQNLLKHNNPDIFIHTWDFIGAPLRGFDGPMARISTNKYISQINQFYKPQKLVIEPAINFPISPLLISKNLDKRDINGILSMFYKMKACNQLKSDYENQFKFKYDCVVRLRSDLMFMNPVHLNTMEPGKLYIPRGFDYEGINDQIAYGSSEIMDKYCNLYNDIEIMLREGEKLNPERLVKTYVGRMNVPLERSNMHYYIKRVR